MNLCFKEYWGHSFVVAPCINFPSEMPGIIRHKVSYFLLFLLRVKYVWTYSKTAGVQH